MVGFAMLMSAPSIDFQEARADSELEVTIVMGAPNHVALGLISEVYVHCKDSYEKMSKEEINWIKEHLFRFLERHSCTIEKKDV